MKILVCEDDLVVMKVIQTALEGEPVEITSAKDGTKALEQLRENTFDLIITDIHMPHHNGDEILKLVRIDQRKNTPIIMISSDTEEEVIAMALKQGVNEFIKKPIDATALRKKLKRFLEF
ncbi:MAG TPA: response regulator [Chryseolinea sp.]|nr:response regulator [Chryseolinea sp.]HPM29053.1 response regulator [Chryseolinea sp.]